MRCKFEKYIGDNEDDEPIYEHCHNQATIEIVNEPGRVYCETHKVDAWRRAGGRDEAHVKPFVPTLALADVTQKECQDGFIRTAIVVHKEPNADEKGSGSFVILDEDGNVVAMINLFDFTKSGQGESGHYDVDVILNTELEDDEEEGPGSQHGDILFWPAPDHRTRRVENASDVIAVDIWPRASWTPSPVCTVVEEGAST